MNRFLALTAIIEVATGLALLTVPDMVVRLLLGAEISGASIPLGRVAGFALLALGVACSQSRGDTQSGAVKGMVAAMLLYNAGVVAVLAFASLGAGLHGVALWPAVVLHAALAVWCLAILRLKIPRWTGVD
ncbi:MAG: hypothetical protein E4H01_07135 [Lysobacterales bacterium]|nr:MAG: hypothetical protein E4H01_07135 [Xanthomonadales bacterium]